MTTRKFPGNFKSLQPISEFVVEQANSAGFTPQEVYAIQTAVDEACSNIIDHAYGGEDIGDIKIRIVEANQGLQIILFDNGKQFSPEDVPQPDICCSLELRKERGLGIYFIHQLMDEVIFDFSSPSENKLTLIKYKGS
jgi:serine/threonine-protein kinase RsbW